MPAPLSGHPRWERVKQQPEVAEILAAPRSCLLAPGPAAKHRSTISQTIRRLAEEDRVFAAREIAAAHADVDLRLACKDPDAYPLKKYGPAFFSALPNRYNVWAGSFIKLREAMDATGGSIQDLSRVNSPAWRRAVAHVLAVRGLPKDVKASPEKLDALGATFRWVNGPRYHKGHPKTWRAMASLFAL